MDEAMNFFWSGMEAAYENVLDWVQTQGEKGKTTLTLDEIYAFLREVTTEGE